MASDIKIKVDMEGLDELVRLDCENIQCRFINLRGHTCTLKHLIIGKSGNCANFEAITKELSEAFHKRLEGD